MHTQVKVMEGMKIETVIFLGFTIDNKCLFTKHGKSIKTWNVVFSPCGFYLYSLDTYKIIVCIYSKC